MTLLVLMGVCLSLKSARYGGTAARGARRRPTGSSRRRGLGRACGLGVRPLHLRNGAARRGLGKAWRTAFEVELTRKTEAGVAAILRHLLKTYDDVVYKAAPQPATVVQRAAAAPPGARRSG
jgi:hypothetical protein